MQRFLYSETVCAYAMGNQTPRPMGRSRALLTETDRERIASDPTTDEEENYRYQAISRVRDRLDELDEDITVLQEHHPELLGEIRGVVCDD